MIEVLDQWLRPTDVGLEWASGRSTIWLAKRVALIDSVEENADWYRKVRDQVADLRSTEKVSLQLVPILDDRSAACPCVVNPRQHPPGSLGFMLVDGYLRDHCAELAVQLIRSGGLLIIDNVERYLPRKPVTRSPAARREQDGFASSSWEWLHAEISGWRSIWTTNGVSETALWVKP